MTPLSQKILENYQVRKTNKQKTAFIELMQEHYPQLQVQQSRFPNCRNLIIGDPEKAEVLLSAHYDTCSALPLPNFITPKKPIFTVLYSLLVVIPLFGLVLLLNYFLNQLSGYYWLNYFVSVGVYFALLALLIIGPANKHTANDNTSGVVTLCELMETLPEDQKDKVCFIFFDHEETGLIGSHRFRRKNKQLAKEKLLINFDCVSDGDYLLLAASKAAREKYGQRFAAAFTGNEEKTVLLDNLEKIYYPSDHAGFQVALAAAALKKKSVVGYYMDRIHTSKDTVFDEKNITLLCEGVQRFLENENGTDTTEVL